MSPRSSEGRGARGAGRGILWPVPTPLVSRPLPLIVCLLMLGCSVVRMPRLHLAMNPPATSTAPVIDDGYEDYAGVIHIHTTYSHDAHGTLEEAVRAANAQHLDYIVITEHNNLRPLQEGKQGWHGGTLVLIGMEISAKGGHYLALDVTQEVDREHLTTQEVIDEVNRQGGFGFIAHPYFKQRRWTDWSVTGFTGIETYNIAHDTLDENRMRLILWTMASTPETFYLSLIDRPYDPLTTWDTLIPRHKRVVGIGAADAHQINILGIKFAPYEMMFQLIRTHVLTPASPLTPESVYAALRAGHAYFSIELMAPAKGFAFAAYRGKELVGVMGDEVAFSPDLTLKVSVPSPAQVILFKDGTPLKGERSQGLDVPINAPGVYRVEAMSHGKPWIFSNPIYVRPPEQPQPPATPELPVEH